MELHILSFESFFNCSIGRSKFMTIFLFEMWQADFGIYLCLREPPDELEEERSGIESPLYAGFLIKFFLDSSIKS